MNFTFINLGCKINQIEMEQASQGLVGLGYRFTDNIDESNFVLINTCTVTAKADKKSLQTIKKCSRQEKLKHIFVTGCYSELEPSLASKVHPKNKIIAQKDKRKMPEIIDSLLKEDKEEYGDMGITGAVASHIPADDGFAAFKLSRVSQDSLEDSQVDFFKHTRAFVKVQDGCNAFCSYCRIPFARGAPVSRSHTNILEHVDRLKQSGVKEIVLSGINIGKYRDDPSQIGFSRLLKDVLDRAGEIRVKISSIEPFSLDRDFFDCVGHPNLAPHIHLPLQGLSDDILRRMNRRYTLQGYRDIVERIYQVRDDFSISTDVIVGYPGESQAVYQAGKEFLEKCGISKIHVFPFSARPFTEDFAGGGSEEVLDSEKKHRSQDLRRFSKDLEEKFLLRVQEREQRLILENRLKNPPPFPDLTASTNGSRPQAWYQGTTEYNLKGIVSLGSEEIFSDLRWSQDSDEFDRQCLGLRGKCLPVKVASFHPIVFQTVPG